jgi:hypothetical protein
MRCHEIDASERTWVLGTLTMWPDMEAVMMKDPLPCFLKTLFAVGDVFKMSDDKLQTAEYGSLTYFPASRAP